MSIYPDSPINVYYETIFQVSADNEEVLSISDALYIEPPYSVESCRSTNEIVLGRVQGLIKNMPENEQIL